MGGFGSLTDHWAQDVVLDSPSVSPAVADVGVPDEG